MRLKYVWKSLKYSLGIEKSKAFKFEYCMICVWIWLAGLAWKENPACLTGAFLVQKPVEAVQPLIFGKRRSPDAVNEIRKKMPGIIFWWRLLLALSPCLLFCLWNHFSEKIFFVYTRKKSGYNKFTAAFSGVDLLSESFRADGTIQYWRNGFFRGDSIYVCRRHEWYKVFLLHHYIHVLHYCIINMWKTKSDASREASLTEN